VVITGNSVTGKGGGIFTRACGGTTVSVHGTTGLTFTLTSTNANLTLNVGGEFVGCQFGAARIVTVTNSASGFSDTLPAGLMLSTPDGAGRHRRSFGERAG
jgi:hypothetical protein